MRRKEYAQGRELLSSLSHDSPERNTFESILDREEGRAVGHDSAWKSLIELGRYRPALSVYFYQHHANVRS